MRREYNIAQPSNSPTFPMKPVAPVMNILFPKKNEAIIESFWQTEVKSLRFAYELLTDNMLIVSCIYEICFNYIVSFIDIVFV